MSHYFIGRACMVQKKICDVFWQTRDDIVYIHSSGQLKQATLTRCASCWRTADTVRQKIVALVFLMHCNAKTTTFFDCYLGILVFIATETGSKSTKATGFVLDSFHFYNANVSGNPYA